MMWRRGGHTVDRRGGGEERGSGTEADAVDRPHRDLLSLLADYQEAGNLGPPL